MSGVIYKPCLKCHITKTLADFYRNRLCKGGYRNVCKTCVLGQVVENSRAPHRVIAIRKRSNEKRARDWREHPEKVRAWKKVLRAVASGRLKRLPCEVCGSAKRVHGHHADYSKPLVVKWLCTVHHMEAHSQ